MKYKVLSYNENKNGVRVDYIDSVSYDDAYISMEDIHPGRHIYNIICIDNL